MNDPFHDGERALQQRVGSRERLAATGHRMILDFMPEPHQEFFAQLPFVVLAWVDAYGQPWATLLAGPPGFVHSPDPHTLRFLALPAAHDPLRALLQPGAPLGVLGIVAETRRRNRVNGVVTDVFDGGFAVRIQQSFGNCPKYIQPRRVRYQAPAPGDAVAVVRQDGLDAAACQLIARSDTFFVASSHPQAAAAHTQHQGVDASHRGGPPGFVRIQSSHELGVPDYLGNGFFNTLGNAHLEPRVGLLFVDFASTERLQVAARVVLNWGDLPPQHAAHETGRSLHLKVEQTVWLRGGLSLAWVNPYTPAAHDQPSASPGPLPGPAPGRA